MSDLVFTAPIAFAYKRSNQPRVRKAVFGDGYEQRVADGINDNPQNWDFAVEDELVSLDATDQFLSDAAGVSAFFWVTPRGDLLRFVCRTWQRSDSTSGWGQISGTFEQVFDGTPPPDTVGLMADDVILGV